MQSNIFDTGKIQPVSAVAMVLKKGWWQPVWLVYLALQISTILVLNCLWQVILHGTRTCDMSHNYPNTCNKKTKVYHHPSNIFCYLMKIAVLQKKSTCPLPNPKITVCFNCNTFAIYIFYFRKSSYW